MMFLLVLFVLVSARQPSYLSLSCNSQDRAQQWLDAAQDSVLLTLQTLFGALDCNGQLVDACYEQSEKLDAITCIKPVEPTCFEGCNLDEQIVVDDVCCKNEFDSAYEDEDGAVCRTNRKWISIAFDKIYTAYEEFEKQTEDGYANAISLACAVETILTAVLNSLGSAFLAVDATYRHIVSPQIRVTFSGVQFATVATLVRTVQSFRYCNVPGQCGNHTLIATYTLFRVDVDGSLPPGIGQLLWPIGGTVSAFDKTFLPSDANCARLHAPTTHSPATDPALRLSTLGTMDYARVVQAFSKCSGFPLLGCVQGYHDLAIGRCCNTLALIKDIRALVNQLPQGESDPTPRLYSFVYVAHLYSKITYESDPTRNVHVENDIIGRFAAADSCADFEAAVFTPASVTLSVEPNAIMTMAPGESRCVGGSDAGKVCTRTNPCGSGLACTSRPGTKQAFCFDGTWWNQKMPCTLETAQCPYGECYGAVSGDSGGQFPFLHISQQNHCDDPERATPVCMDQRVQKWFENPRNKAKL